LSGVLELDRKSCNLVVENRSVGRTRVALRTDRVVFGSGGVAVDSMVPLAEASSPSWRSSSPSRSSRDRGFGDR
jgi:hypothetical protein